MASFVLAHLTDPHLAPLPRPGWRALLNKRLSGYLSWSRKRSRIHLRRILDLVTADLAEQMPDHIVVTGDLVNISLPEEFALAQAWLARLGGSERVTIVPGNHDAYVSLPWAQSLGLWSSYMAEVREPADFPFLRRLGNIALIGVSTAVPMPVFVAAGRIGQEQARRLAVLLAEAGKDGSCRIVLIHHPPFAGGAYKRKSLLDAGLFREAIAGSGAELVLHGHMHVAGLGRLPAPGGSVPVIGAPSASALPHRGKDAAAYHLHRISADDIGWDIATEIRGLDGSGERVSRLGQMRFRLPRPTRIGREASA